MHKNFYNENIWIIGASSGIGRNVAIILSGLGANLILSSRREKELNNLNNILDKKHKVLPLDVSDYIAVKSACDNMRNLDRVLFFPAIYEPSSIEDMDIEFISQIIDINFKSALYVTNKVLPIFKSQKKGQIVLCGSIAGYIGLPNSQPYSSTKAAIINFTESLYAEVPEYIDVKLVSPGFVDTEMTRKNSFKMPMIISSDKAAKYIVLGLLKQKFEINFPLTMVLILKIISILPYKLKLAISRSSVV